jgi:hypothetical protein
MLKSPESKAARQKEREAATAREREAQAALAKESAPTQEKKQETTIMVKRGEYGQQIVLHSFRASSAKMARASYGEHRQKATRRR